jgi:hypothetical protein
VINVIRQCVLHLNIDLKINIDIIQAPVETDLNDP